MFAFNANDSPDDRAAKAYFNLRWTLRLHRPFLTQVFDAAHNLDKDLVDLIQKGYDATGGWGAAGNLNMGPAAVYTAALQTVDGDRGSYYGLIAVLLRTITKRFKEEFQPDAVAWDKLPRLPCGYTAFQIIRAASNNFRHYDDWRTIVPLKNDQKSDMRILAAVMNMQQVPEANWNLAFGHNMAAQIIFYLGQNYGDIEKKVVGEADALLNLSKTATSPGIDVARTF